MVPILSYTCAPEMALVAVAYRLHLGGRIPFLKCSPAQSFLCHLPLTCPLGPGVKGSHRTVGDRGEVSVPSHSSRGIPTVLTREDALVSSTCELLFLLDLLAATPQMTGESTFSFTAVPASEVTHLQIHPGSSRSICCNFYLGPGGKTSYLADFK